MKGNTFLTWAWYEFFKDDDLHRLLKIRTALKKFDLYPDGRSDEDVTPVQVAHFLRAVAIKLNPAGQDFPERIVNGIGPITEAFAKVLGLKRDGTGDGLWYKHAIIDCIMLSLTRDYLIIKFIPTVPEGEDELRAFDDIRIPDIAPSPFERFAVFHRDSLEKIHNELHNATGVINE